MNRIIVLSVATVAILTFSGCGKSEKTAEATKQTTTEVTTTTKEAASKTTDVAKETATKAVEATKEVAQKAKETATKATEAVKESAEKAVDATKEVANSVAEKAKETATKATEAVKETAQKAKDAVTGDNNKGASLFAKCKSCHGADGKTKALGKSEIIAGQNADDLVKKLTEYKAGTRNVAGMGTLMKGQVASMSDEDIKALATYISNLK